MDEDLSLLIALVCCACCGLIAGLLIAISFNHTTEIGQMVCEEKGYGEFIEFDSQNKIIECKKTPQLQEYDGGYIRVIE